MEKMTKVLAVLLISVVVVVVSYIGIFGLSFEGEKSDFYLPTVSGNNASAYKASCVELNISKVFENPDSLVGKKVKVRGELLKKRENFDNTTDIQLKVPELSPYPYIIVTYSTTIPYKEGDKLEVYGEYGYPTETEDMPNHRTVPSIKGVYIEKV